MRLTHEVINSDVIDMELIELKYILDRRKRVFLEPGPTFDCP